MVPTEGASGFVCCEIYSCCEYMCDIDIVSEERGDWTRHVLLNRRGVSHASAQCIELESLPILSVRVHSRQLTVAVGFMPSTLDLSGSRAICSFGKNFLE